MRTLSKEEESIIQQKVDGTISSKDKKKFRNLVRNSMTARRYYQDVVGVNHFLQTDSERIRRINLANEIMQSVSQRSASHEYQSSYRSSSAGRSSRNQIFAYAAAALLIGLFIGGVAMYAGLSSQLNITPSVAGTMIDNPEEQHFSQDGIDVKIQQVKTDKFLLMTVAINSKDTVLCSIQNAAQKLSFENVALQYTDGGGFIPAESDKGKVNYSCSGNNIFQIKSENSPTPVTISFSKGNMILYEKTSE